MICTNGDKWEQLSNYLAAAVLGRRPPCWDLLLVGVNTNQENENGTKITIKWVKNKNTKGYTEARFDRIWR